MPAGFVIQLAAANGISLDLVIWLVVAGIWLFGQIAAAKRKQQRRAKTESSGERPPPRVVHSEDSPAPDELAEIFRRLGADIPQTPPPAPAKAAMPPPAPARMKVRVPAASPYRVQNQTPYRRKVEHPYATRVQPEIARRLARAKKEASEAAQQAEEARRIVVPEVLPGLDVRRDDHQSTNTATRTSGLILPRLHAMALNLSPFPSIPMPAFSRSQKQGYPLPIRLHGRKEILDAVVAQALLHPPRSQSAM